MRKRLLLTFITINIFSILLAPAFSSDWKYTGTMKDGDYYLDFDSIRYDGPMVTFWGKVINNENKEVRTTVNCDNKTWTVRNVVIYKSDGSINAVVHLTEKDLKWARIVPDSAADQW